MSASDFVRLNKMNKYLAVNGAPVNALSSRDRNNASFKTIQDINKSITISSVEQEQVYKGLINNDYDLGSQCLISIGCDNLISGQKVAANICESYMKSCNDPLPLIKWFNLAYWDWDFLKTHNSNNKGIIVVNGLDRNSDPKKLSLARDYINVTTNCTQIVIIETTDVLAYLKNSMGLLPDVVLQIGNSMVQRTRI